MNEIEQLGKDWFRTSCSCGDKRHSISVELEGEEFWLDPQIIFYATVVPEGWDTTNWWRNLKWRIKNAWRLLYDGCIDMEEAFVFRDERQIDAVARALKRMSTKYKNLVASGCNKIPHY